MFSLYIICRFKLFVDFTRNLQSSRKTSSITRKYSIFMITINRLTWLLELWNSGSKTPELWVQLFNFYTVHKSGFTGWQPFKQLPTFSHRFHWLEFLINISWYRSGRVQLWIWLWYFSMSSWVLHTGFTPILPPGSPWWNLVRVKSHVII